MRVRNTSSNSCRDTNTAVNIDARRPIVRVTAKPLTGPVPYENRKKAATSVVTLQSRIVEKALPNPCSTAEPSEPSGWFYENLEHFDLRKHTLDEILASSKWQELESLWQRASRAPRACREYCGVHRDYVEQYDQASRPDRPNKPEDAIAVTIGI